ncbi:MAG: hypothetical protein RL020_1140 [Pseudomonadota bacterium]|jgi:hypothetical protein
MNKLGITKFDAVCAQLDAAIELYFVSDNFIAAHTLAAAAHQILTDIVKPKGDNPPFIKSGYLNRFPNAKHKEIIKFINNAHVFFKHAKTDPHGSLDFNPEITELFLIDACAYFKDSGEQKPKNYKIFLAWAGEINKEKAKETSLGQFAADIVEKMKATNNKKLFWDAFPNLREGP